MSNQTIRPRGEHAEIKLTQTITARNVKTAAGVTSCSEKSRRYHRRRIQTWGRLNREFLRSLGAQIVRKPIVKRAA